MEILFFGNSRSPAIDFVVDPFKGLKLHSRECFCLDYAGVSGTLSWRDFLIRVTPLLDSSIRRLWLWYRPQPTTDEIKEILSDVTGRLLDCTSTATERTFLEQYVGAVQDAPDEFLHCYPALVPQAWVNWLHYRPDDAERAEALRNQPFRVDFFGLHQGRKLVIEIDGWSHISENYLSVDHNGRPAEGPSMLKYTQHLKRDRWLRRQGWEVHRFSNLEVRDVGAKSLLAEIGVNGFPF